MAMYQKEAHLSYAPTQESQLYPETDGQPMAVSDEHRRVLMRTLRLLEMFFCDNPDVYISGDIMTYYVQGDPRKVVAPDVLVAFGIGQKARRTYLVWKEGKSPDFVMELASKTTYERDLGEKMQIYAALGIANYFLCDIEELYLPDPLMGFRLEDGSYHPVPRTPDGRVHAVTLGLDLCLFPGDLRFYDPATGQWLQTPEEAAEARAAAETERAEQATYAHQQAEARAATETERAEAAEAEAAALRAELARLRRNP